MSVTVHNRPQFGADNSWAAHYRASILLGIPLIGAQLAQLAINTTDVILVGKLGTTHLAAIVLATQVYFTVFIFGSGFTNAVVPLAAQAQGRGDTVSVRRSVRMGMWVAILYSILTAPVLWLVEPILVAAGQQPAVAALASEYLHIAQWAMFPSLLFMVLRAFLSGLERASVILYVTILTLILNAFLCYLLIYGRWGFPALGIEGAAIAALMVSALSFIITAWYIQRVPELHSYNLFVRFWKPDWPVFFEVVALGAPIALTILAETGLFMAASLLMGRLGTTELAAHGIAMQFASLAFMIPVGLSQVAAVRVGLSAGRHDLEGIKRAAITILTLGAGCSVVGSLIFALYPRELATLYLDTGRPDAAEVLAYVGPLIILAGVFQLTDGMQAIASGLLRGLKDTKIPMLLALISYWPIGFVFAWVFAFPLGFGGIGVWIGFVVGLLAAAVFLNYRFYRIYRALKARTLSI